ncbi:MAG: flagellar basal body P-ring formation chaperone FlgA [Pseudomonadota bacterium]
MRRARPALRPAAFALAAALAGPAAAQGAADWAPPGWSPGAAPPAPAGAEQVVVAARPVRSGAILTPGDLKLAPASRGGGLTELSAALGREARVTLFAGRPVRPGDIGPPTLIARNALVALRYRRGPLSITAEGRALGRGAQGERIRVMNLGSRRTVTGRVTADGAVEVSP